MLLFLDIRDYSIVYESSIPQLLINQLEIIVNQ